jgi:uncharacterized protein (DUF305 family)
MTAGRRGSALLLTLVIAGAPAGCGLVSGDDDSGTGRATMRSVMRDSVPADEADYLAVMVEHHAEAVAAAAELARSDRPEMRALGSSVVRSQSRQIRRMQDWLAEWYPDRAPASYEPMMRPLGGLSGDALDRTFLQDMIVHHMGAVMASQQLLRRGLVQHLAVESLATRIRADQMREIHLMTRWLRAWFGGAGMPMGFGMHGR